MQALCTDLRCGKELELSEDRLPSGKDENPFVRLYTHLSAIGGGLGLISLFRDLIEWRGFLGTVVEFWRQHVTPIAEFLFGWIAELLGVDWPCAVYDYLTLGVIFALGIPRLRIWVSSQSGSQFSIRELLGKDQNWTPWLVLMPIIAVIAWPIYLLYLAVLSSEYMGPRTRFNVLYQLLSPLMVAAALIAINLILIALGVA